MVACNLRARSVLLVLEVVVILQACHSCMGLRHVLSAGQSLSHAGSSTLHNSWPESTRSPDDESEVSTEDSSAVLKVLRTPLIHRDHPDSPLSKAACNTSSYSERLAAAVKRSLARRDYFSRRLMSSTFDGGFENQVIPDETYVQYGLLTEYTMALSIGTPPQRFFVLIDTGSDLLWLNCKPCNQCINHSFGSPFDPSLSSSYRNTSCTDNFCKISRIGLANLLTKSIRKELQKLITLPQVNQTLHYLFPLCFDLANASIHKFPTITFHFKDASGNGTVHFVLAPENYISLYLEPCLYCLTILPAAESGLLVNVIGNLAQANHQMVFDRVNHQIGWASADCSKL
ncbi:unnamed protein product [Sphagnum troendelagicum]